MFIYVAFHLEAQNLNESTVDFHNPKLYLLNWHNKDLRSDQIPGIALDKAYQKVLDSKKSRRVVVAVIDSGVDIYHEDLEGKIWQNVDEIPGNQIDDDNNGFVDDVNGWNFLGNSDGDNIDFETYEITRMYRQYTDKVDNTLFPGDRDYDLYLKVRKDYFSKLNQAKRDRNNLNDFIQNYDFYKRYLQGYLRKHDFNLAEVKRIKPTDTALRKAKDFWVYVNASGLTPEVIERLQEKNYSTLNYHLNPDFDPREMIMGDDIKDVSDLGYGNNDVVGSRPEHGTHVAGIIAAVRDNGIGVNGIVENVQIMPLRIIPNGDERDKDVANAIRYAVDNGASVINMSFSKDYSPYKVAVDQAVKYAELNNVLIVHGAGNASRDLDFDSIYPNRVYSDATVADNWLTVGASTIDLNVNLAATFSNYGRRSVDIFAPGVDIYSLEPNNSYGLQSGTSMASPVVAGVAAMLMSYYPELTLNQVKRIILNSYSNHQKLKVFLPGQDKKLCRFKRLSKSGGVINAYRAVVMAERATQDLNSAP